MTSTGERIKSRRKELGLTQQQLGDKVGVSGTTLVYWERDENKPKGENLLKLAKVLKTTAKYLIDGIEEKNTTTKIREENKIYGINFNSVPLISAVQAGEWSAIVDDFQPGDADKWIETTAKVGPQAFALKVVGDSMTNPNGMPSIPDGFVVIVDPQAEPINGRVVVAKLDSQTEATVKKLVIDGPNRYLMPLNPRYDKIVINGDCTIVGVVVKMEYDLI